MAIMKGIMHDAGNGMESSEEVKNERVMVNMTEGRKMCTIVVCTPTPEGTHYLRIENTTGYFKMVNGKLIVIDEVDYRLSGFESGW